MYSRGYLNNRYKYNYIENIEVKMSVFPSFHTHFSRFFSIPDDYDLPVCLNKLKLDTQADITDMMVEFVDKVDPISRF